MATNLRRPVLRTLAESRKDRGDDTLDRVEQEIGAVARDEAQRSRTQVQHGAIVGYEIVDEQNDRTAGNRSANFRTFAAALVSFSFG